MTPRHTGVPMGGAAAKTLVLESARQPKVTVKVLRLESGVVPARSDVVADLDRRVAATPLLRRRARHSVRLGWWWEQLPRVDLADHLLWSRLGADRSVEDVVADELCRRLPRDRPCWRIHVLEPVDDLGEVAVLFVADHALLDGGLSARVLSALFGDAASWPEERRALPGPGARLAAGARACSVTAVRVQRALRSSHAGVAGDQVEGPRARIAGSPGPGVRAFSGTAAVWSAPVIDARRGYAEWSVEAGELRALRRLAGVTFTELVVTVVGGALNDAVRDRRRPVTAVVPQEVRGTDDAATAANLLHNLFVDVGAALADPVHRTAHVVESFAAARARAQGGDARLLADAWDVLPVTVAVYRCSMLTSRWILRRPPATLVVSTVRGPQEPLFVAGVPVVSVASGGIITDTLGLNITVWSTGGPRGRVTFGITGRPTLVDVAEVRASLASSWRAVVAAYDGEPVA